MLYDECSYWKGVHFPKKISAMKNREITAPINLHLSLTDACNNRCYYCYVKEQNQDVNTLEKDIVLKLLKSAKQMDVKAIELTGGGEPTVHPDFYEILDAMKEYEFDVGLTTNGYNINPSKLLWLKWIRFSIDTFDPSLYSIIRNAPIININALSPFFNSDVVTGVSCVINKYNYSLVSEFVKEAKDIGFNNVWLKPVKVTGIFDVPKEKIEYLKEQMLLAKTYADDNFKVFSPSFDDDGDRLAFNRCLQQEMCSYVDADGFVYPCCSLQGLKDYRIGSISECDYETIWFNHKWLAAHECPLDCFWWEKNNFLNYLLDDSPKHVNFV